MNENSEITEGITPQEIAEACAEILDNNTRLAISEEPTELETIELAISALAEIGHPDPESFLKSKGILDPSDTTDSQKEFLQTPDLMHDISEELGRGQIINLLKKYGTSTYENHPIEDTDRDTLNKILLSIASANPIIQTKIFETVKANRT